MSTSELKLSDVEVQDWSRRYASKIVDADEAVALVARGQRVFIGSGGAEPQLLVESLARRGPSLADNPVVHIMTLGLAPYIEQKFSDAFRHNAFFIGPNVRDAVAHGRADYTPIFLSEIPPLFRKRRIPIDVALIQVSPPDKHGYCSYGVSVDVVKSAAESARHVVAEVNPNMPRTLGDSFIHVSQIDKMVVCDQPILETRHGEPDEVASLIGRHIASLIEDGSTLQLGIGTIPDAVLACLHDKQDLGIHTEMFSEGVIELVEKGIINGSRKTLHPGKIVASFVLGTRRLYDFVDNNPMCEFHPTEYTNDPFRIAQNDRMVAINSALQIDLTGQVCADSLGTFFYSGIGGQVDFIRGAARSFNGKPIIALPATAQNGNTSRIVPTLNPGAGVVTSRGDVHYIVTEFGIADLHGKTVRERAIALIHIAHPKFRDRLMEEARNRHFVDPKSMAVMSAGSPELINLESDLKLDDGTFIHVRPIRPTDEELHREMFYQLEPETVYHRFFEPLKSLSTDRRRAFCNIDYATEIALVCIAREDEGEKMVAVGRYCLDMATNAAEVAFLVIDKYQHRGIGKYLFHRLLEVARQRGVTQFTAEVMADNEAMMHLFHSCAPGNVKTKLEDGIYYLSFELK